MAQMNGYEYSLLTGTEVGLLVAIAMWGITSIKTATYYADFPSDPTYLKWSVGSIWVCDTIHVILQAIHLNQLMYSVVTRQDVVITRTMTTSFVLASILQSSTQAIYATRMYKFCKKPWLPLLCWVGSGYALVSGIAFAALAAGQSLQELLVMQKSHDWLIKSCFLVTAAVDIAITASFCYLFRRDRKIAGRRTGKILDKLCLFTIQTGMITSIPAVATVSMEIFIPLPGPWLGVFLVLSTLYPLTLVSLLNGRSYLKSIPEAPSEPITTANFQTETKLVFTVPSMDPDPELNAMFGFQANMDVPELCGASSSQTIAAKSRN